MQRAGPPLGAVPGLRVRRGVVTGANDVLVLRSVDARLGGLVQVRAEGARRAGREGAAATAVEAFHAVIEASAVRPLIRGAELDAWRWQGGTGVIWIHDDEGVAAAQPPRRVAAYLARHEARLRRRTGGRSGAHPAGLLRLTPATLGWKVAWHDLADTLKAVAVPERWRSPWGTEGPVIPLNTVYFLPAPGEEDALVLAALLNTLPVRTFARAIAERAKDARFRFFAWTLALLPLPAGWRDGPAGRELLRLSRSAHADGGLAAPDAARLDDAVARLYRLRPADHDALAGFDAWLRGKESST
jgi:hypothetical protein